MKGQICRIIKTKELSKKTIFVSNVLLKTVHIINKYIYEK